MVNPAQLVNTNKPKDPYGLRLKQFQDACSFAQVIFKERNILYGDSITATGLLGATVELVGNVARLYKLVLEISSRTRDDLSQTERIAIEDTLIDIHNYANIAHIMLDKNNLKGKWIK